MNKGRFFLCCILLFIPVKLFGNEVFSYKNPEFLLKQAAQLVRESNEPANISEYISLLQLAEKTARYDKSLSIELFQEAFTIAQNTQEQIERLNRLELLALYAAPADGKISTDSLLLLKLPEGDYQKDWRIQLKMMAIEYVLACKQNLPQKEDILRKAEEFCKEHMTVYKSDIVSGSSLAFTDYVSRLMPELSKEIWTRMYPEGALENRFWLAENNLYTSSQTSITELKDLLGTELDNRSKIKIVVDLYYAGQKEQAIAALAKYKPQGIGHGHPLSDLLNQIAISDPNEAIKLALRLDNEMKISGAIRIVLEQVAMSHTEQLMDLIKYTDSKYSRASIFKIASQSFLKRNDPESAQKLSAAIENGETRSIALAEIAEYTKDLKLLKESMQLAIKDDVFGRSLREITAIAIRGFGIENAKELIIEELPGFQTQWQDSRFFGILAATAEYDPQWTMQILKKGPVKGIKLGPDVISSFFLDILPKLSPAYPEFIEECIGSYGINWESQILQNLKRNCVEEIAKESAEQSKNFAKENSFPVDSAYERELTLIYRTWQITKAPQQANQILVNLKITNPSDVRRIILKASETMIGWQQDYHRDVEGVIKLSTALEKESLADEVLSQASRILFQLQQDKEAIALMNRIKSPWQKVQVLEWFVTLQIYPKSVLNAVFLTGFEKSNPFF